MAIILLVVVVVAVAYVLWGAAAMAGQHAEAEEPQESRGESRNE